MIPISTSVPNYIIQNPLVNTITPGTTVAHVPYDNVAPSVSSSQLDNNTKGNSALPSPAQPASEPVQNSVDAQAATTSSSSSSSDAGGPGISAQSTFIAQLAGQDISPESQSFLVQYEKLVAISNVKYKPSFAFKPETQPSSVFGRIIQDEKQSPRLVVNSADISNAQTSSAAAEASVAQVTEVRPLQRNGKSTSTTADSSTASDVTASTEQPVSVLSAPTPPVTNPAPAAIFIAPQAINAYLSTASRVSVQNQNISAEVA